MWSLFELIPELTPIQIVDIGAMLIEKPPYQPLIDAKRCRVIGFEPNQHECERLNRTYGPPHRFFPYFIGDGIRQYFMKRAGHRPVLFLSQTSLYCNALTIFTKY